MKKNETVLNRIWELDFFRGIALILMVYFHTIYDMQYIFGYNVNLESTVNFLIGKVSAVLFILLSGVSSTLSKNHIKRAAKLILLAAIITLATYFYDVKSVIIFGILHFLGISVLISPLFIKLNKYFVLMAGTIIIILSLWTTQIFASSNLLLIFGITNKTFSSLDYYPLIPWFGVFLYGISLGKSFYSSKESIFGFKPKDNIINIIGRHTLSIYMLHQPAIIAVLYVFNFFRLQ